MHCAPTWTESKRSFLLELPSGSGCSINMLQVLLLRLLVLFWFSIQLGVYVATQIIFFSTLLKSPFYLTSFSFRQNLNVQYKSNYLQLLGKETILIVEDELV